MSGPDDRETPVEGPDGVAPDGVGRDGARAADAAVPYEVAPDGTRHGRPPPVEPGPRRRRGGGRRPRHPWRIAAAVVILGGLVVLVGGYFWVQHEADPSGPHGAQVLITVPAGAGVGSTASVLESKGVIGSSFAFRVWSQFNSVPGVEAGEYAFYENSSFGAVRDILSTGPNVFSLVVPPGFTVSELADRVGQLPGHDAVHVPRGGRPAVRSGRPGSRPG